MIYCAFVLFGLVLFRRFTKQTRLVGSNKILIDLISLNFIDAVVIQTKDIIELNRYFFFVSDDPSPRFHQQLRPTYEYFPRTYI